MHKIRFLPDTITVLQIKREEADTMILKEKERTTIQDLQTQEKSCIEKYGRYAQQAKDPELKNLFQQHKEKFGFFLIRACSHKMLADCPKTKKSLEKLCEK